MSFEEYLSLPKPIRMKKMRKVLSQAFGDNKQDQYIPYLRQPVRSYVLDHNNNTCEEQSATITGMHGGRYRVRSGNKAYHQPPSALRDRYEMEDGLTNEERSVKDLLATQIFERPAPGIVEQRRAEARRSAGMPQKQRPALKAYTVGIIDVYREEDTTYVETLHEDLDRETLPFAQFLRQHAFHDDINKSKRLADIAARSQLINTHQGKHGYAKCVRAKRLAKRRTPVEGVSTRTLLAAIMAYASGACCYTPAQAAETTTFRGNTGSTATPKNYSWTRPGIFRVRALPPPAGAQATRAAGPGLPTGGKTADYD